MADPTGIILVDKPKGITSFQVLNKIKFKFGFKKIGHAGTLDPDATGLLIVLVGAATRLQRFITEEKKSYSGIIQLGITTTTDDTTGEVTETATVPEFTQEKLNEILSTFLGETLQAPPAVSAIKVNGQRAYKLARQGENVVLEKRMVKLYEAELKPVDKTKLEYRLTCSKGFYVRSFARDFALELGTLGATESIRRESTGGVELSQSITLDKLLETEQAPLFPIADFLRHLDRLTCSREQYERLLSGKEDVLTAISNEKTFKSEVILILENELMAGVLVPSESGRLAVDFLVPGL